MHNLNPYAHKRPDFAVLARENASLAPFVKDIGSDSVIDFNDAAALRALSSALLKSDFGLDVTMRDDRLCPTIANRLDYVLTCLDLTAHAPPSALRALDIGTGHVAIYPLLIRTLRPDAAVWASEIDPVSIEHARGVLVTNGAEASESGGITLLSGTESLLSHLDSIGHVSFTMCNPPFFASAAEATSSREAKTGAAPAAPTAAVNEEITRGGEEGFVGQMIHESVQHKHKADWFTSLIGKYSSLESLVAKIKGVSDNYAIIRLQQRRTVRWVLVWSFGAYRLPDELTRPQHLDPSTSFGRLLPPPNTFSVTSTMVAEDLLEAVRRVLRDVGLYDDGHKSDTEDKTEEGKAAEIHLAPMTNSWSRAARRAAERAAGESGATTTSPSTLPADGPLFRCTLRVSSSPDSSTLSLDWTWGSDRLVADAFFKFLIAKTGIKGGKRVREEDEDAGRPARRGRGRGRGAGRGRGGSARGNHGKPRPFHDPVSDNGWAGRASM